MANGNQSLPFQDNSFQTVFSNTLYWLDSSESALKEVWRILRPGRLSLLCFQDHKFKDYCISYRWRERNSEVRRLLNRGRSETYCWTISHPELVILALKLGYTVISHSHYLSPLTLKAWDIRFRPLSPVLIRMVHALRVGGGKGTLRYAGY